MREIKFRAWDKEKRKMVDGTFNRGSYEYGVLAVCLDDGGAIFCSVDELMPSSWEDDRYDIMQYTGLKDKNGKEIYEGDIVRTPMGIGKVFMRLGCWFVENQKELGYFSSHEVEVIGNEKELEGME